MERDRVKRFANRCLFFFGAAGSKSVPTFLAPVCCESFWPEGPSVDDSVRYDLYIGGEGNSLVLSAPFVRASAPGRSGVDSYCFEAIGVFRSLELPLLLGCSVEFSELSECCDLCDGFGALRLPKNDFEASRACLESLGEGKC